MPIGNKTGKMCVSKSRTISSVSEFQVWKNYNIKMVFDLSFRPLRLWDSPEKILHKYIRKTEFIREKFLVLPIDLGGAWHNAFLFLFLLFAVDV